MPRKIRQLKSELRKAGFFQRTGKGSHSVWTHPLVPEARVVLSGHDGADAKPYQERIVTEVLRLVAGKREGE